MEDMGLKEFWNEKKVFITGNTGFKGSWLSTWLCLLGANTRGYSLEPNEDNSLFNLLGVNDSCPTVFGDIRNEDALSSSIHEFEPEIIFHLAAQPLVQESYVSPKETYEINIIGTVNILESALKCPSVKSFINVTSDKVYENKSWEWGYRENERLNGSDPYSNSKSCADLIANCYRHSFLEGKFNLSNVRSGNVIGGGDWAKDRLIPDMIRTIISKEEMTIRNPQSTRPWQHVLEPLLGYILLAQKMYNSDDFNSDWNFGPDHFEDASVEEIARRYSKYWSRNVAVSPKIDTFKEAKYLRLDSSKARTRLGWNSLWDLDETLKKTFFWYEEFLKGSDVKKITIDQIKEYQKLQEKK
jgi:CDP-glucose 4,6-dehydratase